MTYKNKKLGAFIVPTGVGASIGGYAGDASSYARKFASEFQLIVNPNVVNAGCFSGITDNMLYVEGYSLDSFFKGKINLLPSHNNKIGIIYDKAISNDVLNIHINTQNAAKTVYGIDISEYTVTDEPVGVDFYIESGISTGGIKNPETIKKACEKLINLNCDGIAIVCKFDEPEDLNTDYRTGIGIDPVGGVEAVISHYISKEFKIPCAHSPAFEDYNIYPDIVNPKSASEYITPTFLPCILIGLSNAPKIIDMNAEGISINNLDFLIMPHNCLGSTPVFEALKRNIKVYAVKENITALNIDKTKISNGENIIEVPTYDDALKLLKSE